jgi:hypothetical protein
MPKTKSPPTITNVSVTPRSGPGGTSFTASVTASGQPPLRTTYQWKLDGVEIPGATNAAYIASEGGALTVVATARNNEGSDGRESGAAIVSPALSAPAVTEAAISPDAGTTGDQLTAIAAATGTPTPELKYQWLLDGVAIPGATEPSYVSLAPGSMRVRITATNTEGLDSLESAAVMIESDLAPPVIASAAISPATGRVGATFTATHDVTGSPDPSVTYQWRLDDADILGAAGKTFVADTEGVLSVLVNAANSEGSASLETATLAVAPALAAPSVTGTAISPASGRTGDTFTASASITGQPAPSPSYQWILDGVAIPGATDPNHVANSIGDLNVVVTAINSEGSDSLESAIVTVGPALAAPMVADVNISPPTGRVGDTFAAATDASGTPAPTLSYRWFLDGAEVAGATAANHVADAAGSLSLEVTARNSEGDASLASSAVSVLEALAAPVNITPPAISGTAQVGRTLTAVSDGGWSGNPAPLLARQWLRNGVEIPGSVGTTYAVQAIDAGTEVSLRVAATNSEGTVTADSPPISAPPMAAPEITSLGVSPSSGRVEDAFTAGLTVTGNPASSITRQWRLDGVDIPGANGATYAPTRPGSLTVLVTATNSEGVAVQESAAAPVDPALAAPVISSANVSPSSGRVGDMFTATASVSGEPTPALTYQWVLDGVAIPGATGAGHVGTSIGDLSVVVTAINSEGRDALSALGIPVVGLGAGPEISSAKIAPPSGIIGETFQVEAVVTGDPAPILAYQWKLDGVEISGATSSNYQPQIPGQLSAIVLASNVNGEISTESEISSVYPITSAPQNVIAPTISGAANVGSTLTGYPGNWTGTPEPEYSFRWQRDGSDILAATNSTYTLVGADQGTEIRICVDAINTAGTAQALSGPLLIPSGQPIIGTLEDQSFAHRSGIQSYDIAARTIGKNIEWTLDPLPEGLPEVPNDYISINSGAESVVIQSSTDIHVNAGVTSIYFEV